MHVIPRIALGSLVAMALVAIGRANGQSVVPATPLVPARTTPAAAQVSELPAEVFATDPVDPAKAAEEQQKKQQRMQKIQQLTFDRRPSAILKAWATPRDVALDESPKENENQPQPSRRRWCNQAASSAGPARERWSSSRGRRAAISRSSGSAGAGGRRRGRSRIRWIAS